MEMKVKLKDGKWLPNNIETKNYYKEFRKKQIEKIKKQKRKELIMEIVIIAFIIIVFLTIMNFFDKSYKDHMKNCMEAGHSSYYCERGLE